MLANYKKILFSFDKDFHQVFTQTKMFPIWAIYYAVSVVIGIITGVISAVGSPSNREPVTALVGGGVSLVVLIICTPVFALFGIGISALITAFASWLSQLLGQMFKLTSKFEDVFKIYTFSHLPNILAALPLSIFSGFTSLLSMNRGGLGVIGMCLGCVTALISLGIIVWMVYIMIVGFKHQLKATTGQAAVMAIVPGLIIFTVMMVLVICCAVVFAGTFASALQNSVGPNSAYNWNWGYPTR